MRVFLIILIIAISKCVAQVSEPLVIDAMNTISIQNPNTASLMNFYDIPVNYNTGVPNIEIPLFNQQTQESNLSVNLSLNYHPAGIEFTGYDNDEGIGWSIFAEGSITASRPLNFNEYPEAVLFYTFLGHQGEIHIKKIVNTNPQEYQVKSTNEDSIKFEFIDGSNSKFIATDQLGVKYIFDVKDQDGRKYMLQISKIINSNNVTLVDYLYRETTIVNGLNTYKYYKLEEIVIPQRSRVKFDLDYIPNNTGYPNYSGRFNLKALEIYNSSSQLFKKIKLHKDQQINGVISRKVLTKVEFYDSSEQKLYEYKMNYKLSPFFTTYYDHFGYAVPFDDRINWNNTSFFTDKEYCKIGVLEKLTLPTGGSILYDFESNDYSYICNMPVTNDDFYRLNPDNSIPNQTNDFDLNYPSNTEYFITITGNEQKDVDIKVTSTFNTPVNQNVIGEIPTPQLEFKFRKVDNNQVYFTMTTIGSGEYYYRNETFRDVPPGTYKVEVLTSGFLSNWTSVSNIKIIEKNKKNPLIEKSLGGGLRIKRIISFDQDVNQDYLSNPQNYNIQPSRLINYEYDNFDNPNKSSGFLILGKNVGTPVLTPFYYQSTSSLPSFMINKGANVYYTNVKVYDSQTNGWTKHYFISPVLIQTSLYNNLSYISKILTYKKGLPLKTELYDTNSRLIEEKIMDYDFSEEGEVYYIDAGTSSVDLYMDQRIDGGQIGVRYTRVKLIETIKNDYFYDTSNNQNKVSSKINYTYNPYNNLVSETSFRNSTNDIILTKKYYPQDAEMFNEPNVNHLISKNIVGVPLKEQTLKNNFKINEYIRRYGLFPSENPSNPLLLQQHILSKKGTDYDQPNPENKLTINCYDAYGNIMQYTPENSPPVSILWGYNKTQPIAKIENATNAQIEAVLGMNLADVSETNMSSINNLRTSLLSAMVTTYTYKPLVGVETITDPKGNTTRYEYDSFGRLLAVYDNSGNKLSENQYHYRTQN